MESNVEMRRKRTASFLNSFSQLRLWVSLVSALFFSIATIGRGQKTETIVAIFYLVTAGIFSVFPPLRRLAAKTLLLPCIVFDLAVAAYLVVRSGGINSDLYPILFLPVLAAAISCRYPGMIVWCSLMAAVLVSGSIGAARLQPLTVLMKVAYLYLAGFFCGYLVRHTYSATEEVSRSLARWDMDLERFNNFSLEVTGSSNLEEIISQTLKMVRRGDSASMAAMMVFDQKGVLRIFDSLGWDPDWRSKYRQNPLTRNSLALAPILVFQKPLLCPNIRKHEELIKVFKGIPLESLFAFPLMIEGNVAGALVLASAEPRQLPDREVRILSKMTNQAAVAIQNLVILKGKTEKAERDGLTGVYNRGYFNEKLDELIYQAQQKESPLSLIMLDIDNFKEYNDNYGHPAGDQLLKKVASSIAEVVAAGGIVARYGGEEFGVILPDTATDGAMSLAEKIRIRIAGLIDFTIKTRVTISVGVAALPQHAKDKTGLVEYCDKSLYQAKRNGKNRVCCGFS